MQRTVHPAHEAVFANCPPDARNDYWSVAESEWSTDVLVRNEADVLPLTEQLVRASILTHGPGDVLRFMGRTTRADGFPRASAVSRKLSLLRAHQLPPPVHHLFLPTTPTPQHEKSNTHHKHPEYSTDLRTLALD